MATLSFTRQESSAEPAAAKSTWTVSVTASDQTITEPWDPDHGHYPLVNIPTASCTFKYSAYSGKDYVEMQLVAGASISQVRSFPLSFQFVGSLAGGTNKTLTNFDGGRHIAEANELFNASNKTSRTVLIKGASGGYFLASSMKKTAATPRGTASYQDFWINSTIANVKLDVPPTFTSSQVAFNTAYGVYAGLTTASVTVSDLVAYYEGFIKKIVLKIGNQTAELTGTEQNPLTGTQTLSIPLAVDGSFVPEVTVTDSRDQVHTEYLNLITVNSYEITASNLSARRIDPSDSTLDDEGTNAVVAVRFMHTRFTGSALSAPTVKVNGTTRSVTWYTNWTPTGGFSGQVSNWSSLGSDVTLYARITTTMAKETSHVISVIPATNLKSGTEAETTLPQSFYLLVGRPGGHGLGIGVKPPSDAFYCGMDAYFKDTSDFMKSIFDLMHPVHSYFETSLRPKQPNETGELWTDYFEPSEAWGGTWVLETPGMVHVSAGTGYAVSGANSADGAGVQDGGEATHALTPAETATKAHTHTMAHTHTINSHAHGAGSGERFIRYNYSGTSQTGVGEIRVTAASSGTNYVPRVTHASVDFSGITDTAGSGALTSNGSSAANTGSLTAANGSAHNNMQPHINVYRWHRTA